MDKRTSEDYYKESKRIREEVMQQADSAHVDFSVAPSDRHNNT